MALLESDLELCVCRSRSLSLNVKDEIKLLKDQLKKIDLRIASLEKTLENQDSSYENYGSEFVLRKSPSGSSESTLSAYGESTLSATNEKTSMTITAAEMKLSDLNGDHKVVYGRVAWLKALDEKWALDDMLLLEEMERDMREFEEDYGSDIVLSNSLSGSNESTPSAYSESTLSATSDSTLSATTERTITAAGMKLSNLNDVDYDTEVRLPYVESCREMSSKEKAKQGDMPKEQYTKQSLDEINQSIEKFLEGDHEGFYGNVRAWHEKWAMEDMLKMEEMERSIREFQEEFGSEFVLSNSLPGSSKTTLSAYSESTLSVNSESTLSATSDSTLSATNDSTLSATNDSTLSATTERTIAAAGMKLSDLNDVDYDTEVELPYVESRREMSSKEKTKQVDRPIEQGTKLNRDELFDYLKWENEKKFLEGFDYHCTVESYREWCSKEKAKQVEMPIEQYNEESLDDINQSTEKLIEDRQYSDE